MNTIRIEDELSRTTTMAHSPADRTHQLFHRLRNLESLVDAESMKAEGPRLVYQFRGAHRCLPITAGVIEVGRAEECDIALETGGLSRRHFSLQSLKGSTIINDLDSKNGTLVNNEPVNRLLLVSGDIIQAGGLFFVYIED